MTTYNDLPCFLGNDCRTAEFSLQYLEHTIARYQKEYDLDLDPDFQRPLCWSIEDSQRFVEYFLMGGVTGRTLYFNHPNWMGSFEGRMTLVDGKQRLHALRTFLSDGFPVFGEKDRSIAPLRVISDRGVFASELGDRIPDRHSLTFSIASLKGNDLYQWYLDLNSTGKPHTPEELERVRKLIASGRKG